jgi:hypothetical protein
MMKKRWREQPEKMAAGREKAMDAKRSDPIGASRLGVPTGMKREEATELWAQARKLADIAIRGFERMGIVTDVPSPTSPRVRIACPPR